MASTTNVQLTCLCGTVHEDGSLMKATELPIRRGICHCSDCRYSTGVLFHLAAPLRGPPSPESINACSRYASSQGMARYFCKTCGTPTFLENLNERKWAFGTGMIERKSQSGPWPDNTFLPTSHYWVKDTIDYKIAARLMNIADEEIPVYSGDDHDGVPLSAKEVWETAGSNVVDATDSKQLEVRCHCGMIDLRVSRPSWETFIQYPEIVPPEQYRHKYRGSFCPCPECRRAVGASTLAPWAYVPIRNITSASGVPVTWSLEGTNLREMCDYESTKGEVVRSFCRTCGARVSAWNIGRPEMVVIAVGIMRAPEGAAASSWLWWRREVSFSGEGMEIDQALTRAIEDEESLAKTG